MARTTIYKGDDKIVQFTITQGGVALDLSTLTGIIVILYYKISNVVLAKYSLNAIAGYDTLTVEDEPGGIISVNLERTTTVAAETGDVDLEIKVQNTDAEFDNNTFHTIKRDVEVLKIENAISKKEVTL